MHRLYKDMDEMGNGLDYSEAWKSFLKNVIS